MTLKAFSALGFLLCLSIMCIEAQNPYCNPPRPTLPQPSLPMLSKTFNTHMEANFVSKRYSADARMYYDYFQRRASMIMKYKNSELRLIYNYETDEIYEMARSANQTDAPFFCNTVPLRATTALNMFFGYQQLNTTYIAPGPIEQVLHFSNPQVFDGTDEIRGIPVDRWISCQEWKEMNAFFTVSWYFSRTNYTMPNLAQPINQMPVRAHLKGIARVNNQDQPFETIYDFYQFNPILTGNERELLQTPSGVVCANRKQTKPTPKISERYAYSEEIIQSQSIKNLKRVFYDSIFKLVRYEIRSPIADPATFNSLDPLIIIHDYNLGISVGINKRWGNCSIRALENNTFDSDANFTESMLNQGLGFAVKLKSPESFLHLDSVYVYTGIGRHNAIMTDVFISNRTDRYGKYDISSVHEYQFLGPNFEEFGGLDVEKNVPVTLKINLLGDSIVSNYYDFETNVVDLSAFDTTECFPAELRKDFIMTFSYKDIISYPELKTSYIRLMEQFAYYALAKETNETVMRFSPPKISVGEDGNFYVQSSIFIPPPPITLFTKLDNKILYGLSTSLTTKNAEECAQACNDRAKPCLSFEFCTSFGNICFMNDKHAADESVTVGKANNCTHYSRTAMDVVRTKSIRDIWILLENTVSLGLFKLVLLVPSPTGMKDLVFTATRIRENARPNSNFGGLANSLSRFNKEFEKHKFKVSKDGSYTGLSLDDCATRCNIEAGFECDSFDYCSVSGECRTSRNAVSADDVTDDPYCDVYQKDPLYHYVQFPFQTTVGSKDVKIKDVPTESACAKLCDKSTAVHCRSFNYCPLDKSCFLSETHLLEDSQASPVDLVCTHYSRTYLKDFTYRSTANISTIDADIIFVNANIEACATSCVGADGFSCKSFDYCPKSRTCLLRGEKAQSKPITDNTQPFDLCDNYYREYFYLTNVNINVNGVKKDDNGNQGLLIGLSITFSILSAVGGVLFTLFALPKIMAARK